MTEEPGQGGLEEVYIVKEPRDTSASRVKMNFLMGCAINPEDDTNFSLRPNVGGTVSRVLLLSRNIWVVLV